MIRHYRLTAGARAFAICASCNAVEREVKLSMPDATDGAEGQSKLPQLSTRFTAAKSAVMRPSDTFITDIW